MSKNLSLAAALLLLCCAGRAATNVTVFTGQRQVAAVGTNFFAMVRYDNGSNGPLVAINPTNVLEGLKGLWNWDAPTDAELTAVAGRATALEASTNSLGSRATALEARATGAEAATNSLGSRATALEARATGAEAATNSLGSRATALEARATGAEAATNSLGSRVSSLEAGGTTGTGATVHSNAPALNNATLLGTTTLEQLHAGVLVVQTNVLFLNSTNAGSGTNFVADFAAGGTQLIFPTNANFNVPHATNLVTSWATNQSMVWMVDLRGKAFDCIFSFPSEFVPLGSATTNNAVLGSNKLHTVFWKNHAPGQTNTALVLARRQ